MMHNPYLAVFGQQIAASQIDHALHPLDTDTRNLSTESYGKRKRRKRGGLFKKAKHRRRQRKSCKPIGTARPGTYAWKNDPSRYCELFDLTIEGHDEHLDMVRKLRHGKDLPTRLLKMPLNAIIGPFSQMVEMPLRMQKRVFNRRCVPCGFPKKKVWKTRKQKKAAGARKWSTFK